MRRLALLVALTASATAYAQPSPSPEAAPSPEPAPAPPPAPPPDGPPKPDATPNEVVKPPVAVPAAVPKTARQSATQRRLDASAKCKAHAPDCDWIATYSSLEIGTLKIGLRKYNAEQDPAPWGKTIGHVRIVNVDVFAEANWLRFFNLFHSTTRDATIRNELTIVEGEVWDDERVLESQRRLKDPLFTSVVVVLPIKSAEPNTVDMLVVTRDIWSLRLNTKYTIQEGSLTDLIVSFSENNFLGRRKTVALGFTMDQGAVAVGPLYIDKNFLGQHLDLRFRYDKLLTRQSLDVVTADGTHVPTGDPDGIEDGNFRSEGTATTFTLAKPLWALASKWGASSSFSYRDAVARQYFFTGLRAYDDPTTTDVETLPREYRLRTWSARASGTRQWGHGIKQAVETGFSVSSVNPDLVSTNMFNAIDPALRQSFIDNVFPRTEVVSSPFVEYSFYEATYGTLRNVDTYDLVEDVRFGPTGSLGLSQSLKTLGSTYRFTRPSATAGWTVPWGQDGYARVSAGGQVRVQDGELIDNTATASVRATSPTLGLYRLIGQAGFETRWHDTQNQYYSLGSDSGLRAYRINQVIGDRRFLAQLEARSIPYPIWVVRVGGVLFYEGGGSASSFGTMKYLHDAGIGLRMLVPQSSRELFRFDVAFPLASAPGTRAGYPHFIAGFDSYF